MNYFFESKFFSLDLKFYEKLVTMAKKNAYYFFVLKHGRMKFSGQI